jgi:hypothetical protein
MVLKHLKGFEALKTKLGMLHRINHNNIIIYLGTITTVIPCPRHRVNTR